MRQSYAPSQAPSNADTSQIKQTPINLSSSSSKELLETLTDKIIDLHDDQGVNYFDKFSPAYIHSLFSKNLSQLERLFNELNRSIDLIDFLYIMLNYIEHNSKETLYLAIALIDFFQGVAENERLQTTIRFSDFTSYICDYNPLVEGVLPGDQKIPRKLLPQKRYFAKQAIKRQVREIDTQAPIIYRDNDQDLKRLNKEKIQIDSIHHNKDLITASYYAKKINKIIALDSYSDKFLIYNTNCKLEKQIQSQNQLLKGQVAVDFCWSEKQQRIGAVYRDQHMCFWDAADNFEFEKTFHIAEFCPEDQTKIWYINCIDQWVTTDQRNVLNLWNLLKEKPDGMIQSRHFSHGIMQLQEINYLELVAVSSHEDKTKKNVVTMWDLKSLKCLFKLDANHNILHSICFFQSFQVLLTAGYDNDINIYGLHPFYNDYSKMGELYGHSSLVTALQVVENTPMVISADERFNIKVWDIRTTQCIQNISLEFRSSIKHIHVLEDKICFVSSRISCVEFEKNSDSALLTKEECYPLRVEYDNMTQQLIVCTRKDLRFIDIETGKTNKILGSLTSSGDDEITSFRLFKQNKKFIVGNVRGELKLFLTRDGEMVRQIKGHTDEVSCLKMDYTNQLLISGSNDSNVKIQKEVQNNNFETLREINNIHYGKEITILELSVFHNLLITATETNCIFLWNYEFGKMIASIQLEENTYPTSIEFVNGYAMFIISTSNCYIYFIHFKIQDDSVELDLVGNINLVKSLVYRKEQMERSGKKDNTDSQALLKIYLESETRRRKNSRVSQSTNRESSILSPSISGSNRSPSGQKQQRKGANEASIFVDQRAQSKHHTQLQVPTQSSIPQLSIPKNQSYKSNELKSPMRSPSKTPFMTRIIQQEEKEAIDLEELYAQEKEKRKNESLAEKKKEAKKSLKKLFATRLLVDLEQEDLNAKKPKGCKLVIGISNGEIRKYDIGDLFKRPTITLQQHVNTKANYNAHRSSKVDFVNVLETQKIQNFVLNKQVIMKEALVVDNLKESKALQKFKTSVMKLGALKMLKDGANKDESERTLDPFFAMSQKMTNLLQAHKENLTCMQFIHVNNTVLITSSQDLYVKIWRYPDLQLTCQLNIHHALPIYWNISIDYSKIFKTKILFALKAMQCVFNKYRNQLNFMEERKYSFHEFFTLLLKKEDDQKEIQNGQKIDNNKSNIMITQPENESKQKYPDIVTTDQDKQEFSKSPQKNIQLMKDEYSPRDLIFHKIKNLYQNELQGPSLKQLAETKKLDDAQKAWRKQKQVLQSGPDDLDMYDHLQPTHEEKTKEHKQIMKYFDISYKEKTLKPSQKDITEREPKVQELNYKLNQLQNKIDANFEKMQQEKEKQVHFEKEKIRKVRESVGQQSNSMSSPVQKAQNLHHQTISNQSDKKFRVSDAKLTQMASQFQHQKQNTQPSQEPAHHQSVPALNLKQVPRETSRIRNSRDRKLRYKEQNQLKQNLLKTTNEFINTEQFRKVQNDIEALERNAKNDYLKSRNPIVDNVGVFKLINENQFERSQGVIKPIFEKQAQNPDFMDYAQSKRIMSRSITTNIIRDSIENVKYNSQDKSRTRGDNTTADSNINKSLSLKNDNSNMNIKFGTLTDRTGIQEDGDSPKKKVFNPNCDYSISFRKNQNRNFNDILKSLETNLKVSKSFMTNSNFRNAKISEYASSKSSFQLPGLGMESTTRTKQTNRTGYDSTDRTIKKHAKFFSINN